jgi:hypothetical protein
LNTFIAQQENFRRGELVAIRGKGDYAAIEIDDRSSDKPAKNAVVTTGAPPPKARVIGSAEILIGNKPAFVNA